MSWISWYLIVCINCYTIFPSCAMPLCITCSAKWHCPGSITRIGLWKSLPTSKHCQCWRFAWWQRLPCCSVHRKWKSNNPWLWRQIHCPFEFIPIHWCSWDCANYQIHSPTDTIAHIIWGKEAPLLQISHNCCTNNILSYFLEWNGQKQIFISVNNGHCGSYIQWKHLCCSCVNFS